MATEAAWLPLLSDDAVLAVSTAAADRLDKIECDECSERQCEQDDRG